MQLHPFMGSPKTQLFVKADGFGPLLVGSQLQEVGALTADHYVRRPQYDRTAMCGQASHARCGSPPIKTVAEPLTMVSGGPTQVQLSVARAAGRLLISTVGLPGESMGPPTWGTIPVTMGHVL